MQRLIILFVFLQSGYAYSQKVEQTKSDTVKINASHLEELSKKIDALMKVNDSLYRDNKKLNGDLLKYIAEENFYATALDRQATHYEWLLGVALAIAGLVSYSFINNRFQVMNRTIAKTNRRLTKGMAAGNEQIEKWKSSLIELKVDHYSSVAYNYLMLASREKDAENYKDALRFYQSSVENYLKCYNQSSRSFFNQYILHQLPTILTSVEEILVNIFENEEDENLSKVRNWISENDFEFFHEGGIEKVYEIENLKICELSNRVIELMNNIKGNEYE